MTRLVTAFIAATLALAVPAHAYEIGQTLQWHGADRLPIVGCSHPADTAEAQRLMMVYSPDRAYSFALRVDDFVGGRACVIFKDPSEKFRIVDRRHPSGSSAGFFCIESTRPGVDVGRPKGTEVPPAAKPLPCFWVFVFVPPK